VAGALEPSSQLVLALEERLGADVADDLGEGTVRITQLFRIAEEALERLEGGAGEAEGIRGVAPETAGTDQRLEDGTVDRIGEVGRAECFGRSRDPRFVAEQEQEQL